MLVASATIDGHAVALRLERADTLTLPRWVDARPVMPWCQELTVVHPRTAVTRETLSTKAKVDIIMNCESTPREQLATATPAALRAAGVSDDVVAARHGHDETIMRAVYSQLTR